MPPALHAGVSEAMVTAIKSDLPPPIAGAGKDEDAIYSFVYQIYHGKHRVDQKTWLKIRELLGEKGAVELMAMCAGYCFVSMCLNVDEFPVPSDATGLEVL